MKTIKFTSRMRRCGHFALLVIAISVLLLSSGTGQGLTAEAQPNERKGWPKGAREAQRAPRSGPRPERGPRITAESLPPEMAKARQQLKSAPPPPASVAQATLNQLRNKQIGINVLDDNLALWEVAARSNDFAKVGPLGYGAAELLTKGLIGLQSPRPGGRMGGVPPKLMERAWALSLDEQATPEEHRKMSEEAHAKGKKFIAAPTGARLLEWGDVKVAELARQLDLLVIQAERWYYEDNTPEKKDYLGNVLRFSGVIRKANPQCKIFIELGRRLDRGGGASDELLRGLALLYEKAPESFDGFYPFITRQTTNDPKQGLGALTQLLAWLRPEALSGPGGK